VEIHSPALPFKQCFEHVLPPMDTRGKYGLLRRRSRPREAGLQSGGDLRHCPGMAGMLRQKVLVLYLANSALDSPVIAWAVYDGTGERLHMAGDDDEPSYRTGLADLRDGCRLFQASQLNPHPRGEEFDLAYLKYEFFLEQLAEA